MKRVDCKGSFLFSLCKEKCVRWLIIFFKDRPRRLKQWDQTFFEAAFESSFCYNFTFNLQYQDRNWKWHFNIERKWRFKCDTKVVSISQCLVQGFYVCVREHSHMMSIFWGYFWPTYLLWVRAELAQAIARAEEFSAWLVAFFTSARNQKLAKNELKFWFCFYD